jgi:hypothetical protein
MGGFEPCKDDISYALLHANPSAVDHSVPDSPSACSDPPPRCYTLEGSTGLAAGRPAVSLTFGLADCATHKSSLARACCKTWDSGSAVILQAAGESLPGVLDPAVLGRAAGDRVQTVRVTPVSSMFRRRTMAFLNMSTS